MKMYVQMSQCLGLLSWKVDGVCEWKWQAMVTHKTAFSSFAVLCERYNLITKIHLFFSPAQTGQRMFSIQYSIVPQFLPVCRVQGLCVGPGAAPHTPGLWQCPAAPFRGTLLSLLCLLHLGFVVVPGESRPWGLSAGTRALPGAAKKGCKETKMNLNVPKCLL